MDVTVLSAADAALTMRKIKTRLEFEAALRKCLDASARRDSAGVHHYLNRAACLWLGLDDSERTIVREADTPDLIRELRRRASDERDEAAAQALKIRPTNIKERARA